MCRARIWRAFFLTRNVDCERARSFRKVHKGPRPFVDEAEAQAAKAAFRDADENRGNEPFPVLVSSVAATLEVQVGRGLSSVGLPQLLVVMQQCRLLDMGFRRCV
jgi:hypothetical protein